MRDHDAIKAEIESAKVAGIITPAKVVELARNPGSAMHDCFTWDDGIAADAWRIEEARRLIRVYVIRTEAGDKVVPVRAFVSLSSDRKAGGGYRTLVDVLDDDQLREQMMRDALDELRAMQVKYSRIRELDPVFAAADQVSSMLDRKGPATKAKGRKAVGKKVA